MVVWVELVLVDELPVALEGGEEVALRVVLCGMTTVTVTDGVFFVMVVAPGLDFVPGFELVPGGVVPAPGWKAANSIPAPAGAV